MESAGCTRLSCNGSGLFSRSSRVVSVRLSPERRPTCRDSTQDHGISTRSAEQEVNIEAHAVGAYVVEARIQHPRHQAVHLDLPDSEALSHRAVERHMQGALALQVMVEAGLVRVTKGHPIDPGEHQAPLDGLLLGEVGPLWSQPTAIEAGEDVLIRGRGGCRHHDEMEGPIALAPQHSCRQGDDYLQRAADGDLAASPGGIVRASLGTGTAPTPHGPSILHLPGSAQHHGRARSVARTNLPWLFVMFPPFASCYPVMDGAEAWRHHQSNKLRMLTFWRDATERRLAALNAAISTLEQQIARDQPVQGS
jgi:hypothetical protein